jgi:hypothetical protein
VPVCSVLLATLSHKLWHRHAPLLIISLILTLLYYSKDACEFSLMLTRPLALRYILTHTHTHTHTHTLTVKVCSSRLERELGDSCCTTFRMCSRCSSTRIWLRRYDRQTRFHFLCVLLTPRIRFSDSVGWLPLFHIIGEVFSLGKCFLCSLVVPGVITGSYICEC